MEYAFAPALALRGAVRGLYLRPCSLPTRASPRVHVAVQRRGARVLVPPRASATPAASAEASAETGAAIATGRHMSSREIRDAFLGFYAARGHERKASASLVPADPTIMLTIAGMVPFKPIFLGAEQAPEPPRATTSQKCIRTNDIENVGVTKRHHTFFEMLGNFSFGDYFKQQAIEWSWELLTKVYEIPPERLAVSVFEEDDEAFAIWRDVVGVEEGRIRRMGAEDNFWASGPTGPCGPCSEIYYDFDPASKAEVDLEDDDRFIELYNLVFMQYSRAADGVLTPLAAKNIDTGMGLERMAQVLQCVENNYETDLIRPIMDKVASLVGIEYSAASPKAQTSLKVTGDHIRAVAHLISDGVRASNIGRGYIVRRLIRRIVRHGRLLGLDRAFIGEVLPVVADLASEAGLDGVQSKLAEIASEVGREEERFLATLERGEARLSEVMSNVRSSSGDAVISGEDAFELYDTFGFPLELTEEIAAEENVSVDRAAFEVCMQQQRDRARAARGDTSLDVEAAAVLSEIVSSAGATTFSGYNSTSLPAVKVTGVVLENSGSIAEAAEAGEKVRLLLDETPFYAEGGCQVGDAGLIRTSNGAVVRIDDTKRESGAYVHVGEVVSGTLSVGSTASANVDAPARRRIKAHHTATHLLQSALREVIPDGGISQAGSLVDADRLRFDFNCPRAVTPDEIAKVEDLINSWISAGHDTVVEVMPIDEAKSRGAVAMFGEKYGDEVRVVDVPGVSMELCGGTHVDNTADIGLFKVVSESGPSSGVRRIEAVCGAAVLPYLNVRDASVKKLCFSLKARPDELPDRVASLQDELRATVKELEAVKAQVAVSQTMALADSAEIQGDGKFVISLVEGDVSADSLKLAAERLGQRLGDNGVVILASIANGKVSFVGSVGKSLQSATGLHAGKLVGAIAKVCGGGGGGRPNLAQAGGRDPSRIDDALAKARDLVEEALS